MPNWCANHVEISGPTEKIQDLYDKTRITDRQTTEQGSEVGFLEYLAPIGDYDREDAIQTWGTNWEVDVELDLNYTDSGAMVTGYFDSAWSPPVPALLNYLENNTDCDGDIYYYEPAMDFCGNVDCHITISDHNKTFFQNNQIGKKLDDHFDIVGMIEESEELEQEEALQTPPDQMEGTESEEDV